MRILLLSTLKRKVTQSVTASRSRIIYTLAAKLADRGHKVSLLGTGDSLIEKVETISIIDKGWIDLPAVENPFYREVGSLVLLARRAEELSDNFDIIHNHTYPELVNLLITERIKTPIITTLHQQATKEYDEVVAQFPHTHFVALSKAHRRGFQKARIDDVVYNGIDTSEFAFQPKKQDYLFWLGRLSKAKDKNGQYLDPKGVKWAIKLAKSTGEKLVLAGAVEDQAFFDKEVAPHLSEKIRWYGPVANEQALTRSEVINLMQNAKAFLMTINWEEPFGMVMAEAGSCGTPVIAFARGAAAEIVKDGLSGFVVEPKTGLEGLRQALAQISNIDPAKCRKHIEDNFSLDKMVDKYLQVYQRILSARVD
jgi:glycosyltransferase involved in cell wall biosynthesis